MKIVFFCSLLCWCLISCGQENHENYCVDETIVGFIQEKTKNIGLNKSVIEFKIYEEDSLILDSNSKKKQIECLTTSTFIGDTLIIRGWFGMFSGFGYIIKIVGEEYEINHFLSYETPGYKLQLSDSLTSGLIVPCVQSKLTLTKRPDFKEVDYYSGVVYLESDNYYTVNNGETKKMKIELTSYFRAKSQKFLLKELEKNKPSNEDIIMTTGTTGK